MTVKYKINELFETIQGEGAFTGQPSIFIRLQGCPVACDLFKALMTDLMNLRKKCELRNCQMQSCDTSHDQKSKTKKQIMNQKIK